MLRIHVIVENILREAFEIAQRTTQLHARRRVFVQIVRTVMQLLVLIQLVSKGRQRKKELDSSRLKRKELTDRRILDRI